MPYSPQTETTRILARLLALVGMGKLGLTAVQYERLRRGVIGEHCLYSSTKRTLPVRTA